MEDSNVQIKVKGQRKSKKKEVEQKVELPTVEPEEEQHEEHHEEEVEEEIVEEKPKKKAPKKKPTVEVEDYDIERQPDVVIHKRHKGAKPRKIIVVTGDSSANESDEDLPYRKKPNIQIKKRSATKKPEPEPEPEPEPAPKPPKPARKQNVGLVTEKPHVVDSGKGMSQRYADQATKKSGYVVDEMIDKLLGLC